eukprot:7587105-Alexandrium_andersonii.AAC.1
MGKLDNTSFIVWCDWSKKGRLTAQDLNDDIDAMRKVLGLNPKRCCGFIICPVLTSARVLRGK